MLFNNKFMMQVLDRGEKIELLVDRTENLRSQVSKCISFCLSSKLDSILSKPRQDRFLFC